MCFVSVHGLFQELLHPGRLRGFHEVAGVAGVVEDVSVPLVRGPVLPVPADVLCLVGDVPSVEAGALRRISRLFQGCCRASHERVQGVIDVLGLG